MKWIQLYVIQGFLKVHFSFLQSVAELGFNFKGGQAKHLYNEISPQKKKKHIKYDDKI